MNEPRKFPGRGRGRHVKAFKKGSTRKRGRNPNRWLQNSLHCKTAPSSSAAGSLRFRDRPALEGQLGRRAAAASSGQARRVRQKRRSCAGSFCCKACGKPSGRDSKGSSQLCKPRSPGLTCSPGMPSSRQPAFSSPSWPRASMCALSTPPGGTG